MALKLAKAINVDAWGQKTVHVEEAPNPTVNFLIL